MRYTVTRQVVQVIGRIWMPAVTCAQSRNLDPYDLRNIGDAQPNETHEQEVARLSDRDAVEHWVALHFGDFATIEDFRADFHVGDEHIVHEWKNEESEVIYSDCMFPAED